MAKVQRHTKISGLTTALEEFAGCVNLLGIAAVKCGAVPAHLNATQQGLRISPPNARNIPKSFFFRIFFSQKLFTSKWFGKTTKYFHLKSELTVVQNKIDLFHSYTIVNLLS